MKTFTLLLQLLDARVGLAKDRRGALLTTVNKGLKEEVSQLRTETHRLREDISRYRGNAARLSDELRNHRDWNYSQLETRRYDDTIRGYGSRTAYDPYDRRY